MPKFVDRRPFPNNDSNWYTTSQGSGQFWAPVQQQIWVAQTSKGRRGDKSYSTGFKTRFLRLYSWWCLRQGCYTYVLMENAFWQAPLKLFWATLLEHTGSAKGYSSNENTSYGCMSLQQMSLLSVVRAGHSISWIANSCNMRCKLQNTLTLPNGISRWTVLKAIMRVLHSSSEWVGELCGSFTKGESKGAGNETI